MDWQTSSIFARVKRRKKNEGFIPTVTRHGMANRLNTQI